MKNEMLRCMPIRITKVTITHSVGLGNLQPLWWRISKFLIKYKLTIVISDDVLRNLLK